MASITDAALPRMTATATATVLKDRRCDSHACSRQSPVLAATHSPNSIMNALVDGNTFAHSKPTLRLKGDCLELEAVRNSLDCVLYLPTLHVYQGVCVAHHNRNEMCHGPTTGNFVVF